MRHAQFGVGTVLSIESAGDDTKLTVRFASVGVKKLMARFARLDAGVGGAGAARLCDAAQARHRAKSRR